MVHVMVVFTDADGVLVISRLVFYQLEILRQKTFFQLIHILENDITKFLKKDWYIKKYQGYNFFKVSQDSIDFTEFSLKQKHAT